MQSGSNVIAFHKSRGSYVMDRYMDGFKGVVVTDGYTVSKRFEAERHQLRWVHELRHADDVARNGDGRSDARRLHEEMQYVYSNAKASLREEGLSPELRQSFQAVLGGMLGRTGPPGTRSSESWWSGLSADCRSCSRSCSIP